MPDRATITGKHPGPSQEVRILYMEDDAGLARLLQKHLGRMGYRVDLAVDGEQGLALVREHGYQAVLLDYSMPALSGTSVLAALVELDPLLPVVMVTGNGDERVAVEAMKLGARDYLVKDLDMRYLERLPIILEKLLLGRKLARERERTLVAIRESEERYRKLVELSPDGIVICCDSRIEFANPAALHLLGAGQAEQLLGAMILGFVHPDSVDLFEAQLELIQHSGANVPWLEERFIRLDYAELDVEVSGVPFSYRGAPAVQIIFRDVTARTEAKQLLQRLAYYDQLTRLPNRALFFDRLTVQLAQAQRYRFSFALLYLDLDGFKQVNDTLGHDQGDRLLRQVAGRLEGCLRSSDTVSRIGGDEFVILMARIKSPADAELVATKIVNVLREPFYLDGECCRIGGSVGIGLYPDDAGGADALLSKADSAMYQAKQAGGNGFRLFQQEETPSPPPPSP
jgi:diguanylate cyclase (GGDEF)-like protein/PAS domain S-box-containing protein